MVPAEFKALMKQKGVNVVTAVVILAVVAEEGPTPVPAVVAATPAAKPRQVWGR